MKCVECGHPCPESPATPPLDVGYIEGVVSTALVELGVSLDDQRHIMRELRAALANPDPETAS